MQGPVSPDSLSASSCVRMSSICSRWDGMLVSVTGALSSNKREQKYRKLCMNNMQAKGHPHKQCKDSLHLMWLIYNLMLVFFFFFIPFLLTQSSNNLMCFSPLTITVYYHKGILEMFWINPQSQLLVVLPDSDGPDNCCHAFQGSKERTISNVLKVNTQIYLVKNVKNDHLKKIYVYISNCHQKIVDSSMQNTHSSGPSLPC